MSLALGFLDQYVEEIRVALDRIRIINHCRLDEISFENSVWKRTDGTLLFPAGYNPNHTRDDCKIFHVAGGQLSAQLKPEDLKPSDAGSGPDPYAPNVHRLQILGVGSDEPEIIIHWRVPIAACIAFNERMGIAALASDLTTGLQAHYETSGIPAIIGDEVSYIVGRSDIAYIGTGGANPVSCRISYTLAIN